MNIQDILLHYVPNAKNDVQYINETNILALIEHLQTFEITKSLQTTKILRYTNHTNHTGGTITNIDTLYIIILMLYFLLFCKKNINKTLEYKAFNEIMKKQKNQIQTLLKNEKVWEYLTILNNVLKSPNDISAFQINLSEQSAANLKTMHQLHESMKKLLFGEQSGYTDVDANFLQHQFDIYPKIIAYGQLIHDPNADPKEIYTDLQKTLQDLHKGFSSLPAAAAGGRSKKINSKRKLVKTNEKYKFKNGNRTWNYVVHIDDKKRKYIFVNGAPVLISNLKKTKR
jgi:hypothetical protein